jgi:uncharacterized protein (DUF1778 family)
MSKMTRVLVDAPESVIAAAKRSGDSVSRFIELAAIEKAEQLSPKMLWSEEEREALIERLTNPAPAFGAQTITIKSYLGYFSLQM